MRRKSKKTPVDTPLLGIYPEENMIQKDIGTPVFTAALFTMAKTWKPPKCPSTGKWVRKMGYIYSEELERMK